MPFARLTMTTSSPSNVANKLAADLTDVIARDLGKSRDLTSLLVETPGNLVWTVGAKVQKTAAHFEVCVTAGTNSEQQKQTFVANAMTVLQKALPDLSLATYVVVKEVPATDWGYDGHTQADRARLKARNLA